MKIGLVSGFVLQLFSQRGQITLLISTEFKTSYALYFLLCITKILVVQSNHMHLQTF